MENLYRLKDALMNSLEELDTLKSGKLKMGELEALNYITDTIKNIDKICMLEEDGGYSGAGNWDAHMTGEYGNSYRRDRRYSRDGRESGESYNDGGSSYANRRRNYSNYSYAGGKEVVMKHLEKAMDNATEAKEREAIERAMKIIENA